LLDLRLTQPPSEYSGDSLGTQLSQNSLPQPRPEARDVPPSLDRFIPNSASAGPAGWLAPESQLQPEPQPLHNHSSPQVPPQGPNVPPNTCHFCQRSFSKTYQLNRHIKSHTRPFRCPNETCPNQGFQFCKDLTRHLRAKHPEQVPEADRYYCSIDACKHSKRGGKGFARLDHLNRHERKKHPTSQLS